MLFAHRLAAQVGELDVDKVLSLPISKFKDWRGYYHIERFSAIPELLAHQLTLFHSVHKAKSAKATTVRDWLGDTYFNRRIQSQEEIAHRLNMTFGTNL